MKDRIIRIMKEYKMTSTQFADATGIARAGFSHIMADRYKPSLEVVTKILEYFFEISPDWLLFGKGEMMRNVNNRKKQGESREPDLFLQPESNLFQPVTKKHDVSGNQEKHKQPDIPELENTVKTTTKDSDPVVQKEKIIREIEEMRVFYTDGTFEKYVKS